MSLFSVKPKLVTVSKMQYDQLVYSYKSFINLAKKVENSEYAKIFKTELDIAFNDSKRLNDLIKENK